MKRTPYRAYLEANDAAVAADAEIRRLEGLMAIAQAHKQAADYNLKLAADTLRRWDARNAKRAS